MWPRALSRFRSESGLAPSFLELLVRNRRARAADDEKWKFKTPAHGDPDSAMPPLGWGVFTWGWGLGGVY
jgi:hypothetical protein